MVSEDVMQRVISRFLDHEYNGVEFCESRTPISKSDVSNGTFWLDPTKKNFLYDPKHKLLCIGGHIMYIISEYFNFDRQIDKTIPFIKNWIENKVNLEIDSVL
jgi:hypothetical protein